MIRSEGMRKAAAETQPGRAPLPVVVPTGLITTSCRGDRYGRHGAR